MAFRLYPSTPFYAANQSQIILWNVLAFQAGSLNVGGFLACQRFVTHVTGFATLFGSHMAQKDYTHAWGYLSVPFFFLAGSMISALIIDQRIQSGKKPLYRLSFGFLFFIMTLILALSASHVFGKFGTPVVMAKDYGLLALLCLASGLQNATVTSAYGAVVRTTHLTGITTDLGIGLVRLFSKLLSSQEHKQELSTTFMRLGIIASFTLGSLVSAYIFVSQAYWGFGVPFLTSLGLWFFSFAFSKEQESK